MFQQSLTCAALSFLKESALNSSVYRIILMVAAWLSSVFEKSIVRNWVVGNMGVSGMYSSSLFYAAMQKLVNWFLKLSRSVYVRVSPYFKKSLVNAGAEVFRSRGWLRFEYLLAVVFALIMIVPHSLWNNIYAVAGAFALAMVYYVRCLDGKKLGTNVKAVPVSLVAFIVAIIASIVISPTKADSVKVSLFFFSSVGFALLIGGGIDGEKELKTLVTVIISAMFLMCLYAIYQNFMGVEVDILLTDVATNEGMPGRVYSTFENPNCFAQAIVLVLPFMYAMFICSERRNIKLAFGGVFVICFAALAMTYSRSCYISFAIATVVFAALYNWKLLIPLGILVIVAIPFLPETILNRILTIGSMEDTSNAYRIYLWEGTLKMLRSVGWGGIGIGPGAFAHVYPEFASPLADKAPHCHMLYMELLVEIGIVGALGFLAYMGSVIKKGLRTYSSASKTLRCMIIAAISSLAGISFAACAEYIWFYPRVMFVFWAIVGLLIAAVRCARKKA